MTTAYVCREYSHVGSCSVPIISVLQINRDDLSARCITSDTSRVPFHQVCQPWPGFVPIHKVQGEYVASHTHHNAPVWSETGVVRFLSSVSGCSVFPAREFHVLAHNTLQHRRGLARGPIGLQPSSCCPGAERRIARDEICHGAGGRTATGGGKVVEDAALQTHGAFR